MKYIVSLFIILQLSINAYSETIIDTLLFNSDSIEVMSKTSLMPDISGIMGAKSASLDAFPIKLPFDEKLPAIKVGLKPEIELPSVKVENPLVPFDVGGFKGTSFSHEIPDITTKMSGDAIGLTSHTIVNFPAFDGSSLLDTLP